MYVQGNDIDTDRIIPARFMKCVTFDGLGEFLFYDVRKDDKGNDKEHPLNESRFSEASILISNANFGCGSSREHAPQALYRYIGRSLLKVLLRYFSVIVAALVFLVPFLEDINKITDIIDSDPSTEIKLDIVDSTVSVGDLVVSVEIPQAAKDALTHGRWDPIAELQEAEQNVDELINHLGYLD